MKIIDLKDKVLALLGSNVLTHIIDRGELTITVNPDTIVTVLTQLRESKDTLFEQCVDLCGVDYLTYHDDYVGPRFAVVYHLLSIEHNVRLRVKAFILNDNFPVIKSVKDVYNGLDWFEREAFDLYGIIFDGHPDLRRLLTDYGFIGHPFRKDFPISGFMEMRYDETEKRVIYQPVTIEPREITPRVIREEIRRG